MFERENKFIGIQSKIADRPVTIPQVVGSYEQIKFEQAQLNAARQAFDANRELLARQQFEQ